MIDQYLDALNALDLLLEIFSETDWRPEIKKDIESWKHRKSASEHISHYGAMGSFNDILFMPGFVRNDFPPVKVNRFNQYFLDTQTVAYSLAKNHGNSLSVSDMISKFGVAGTGTHYGLAEGEYRISLDNESQGEYLIKSATLNITQFGFSTWTSNATTFYADAIGFSWDGNYIVGQNYQCGNITDFYEYVSTKIDLFNPCLMNLPDDVLNLADWVRDYENSDQGSKPQNANAYWQQWWESVWEGVQEKFQKFVESIVLAFLSYLGDLVWLLIRAALLSLIYIALALIMFSLTLAIAMISLVLIPIITIFGGTLSYSANKVQAAIKSTSIEINYLVIVEYNSFLDAEIPFVKMLFNLGESLSFESLLKMFPIGGTFTTEGSFFDSSLLSSSALSTSHSSESLKSSSEEEDAFLEIKKPEENSYTNIEYGYEDEGFISTNLEFEYKDEDYDNDSLDVTFKYTIERIDYNTEFFESEVIEGTVEGEYDESSHSYKGSCTEYVGEGLFKITVELEDTGDLSDPDLVEENTFHITRLDALLDGFGFALTIFSALNVILAAYSAAETNYVTTIGMIITSIFPCVIGPIVEGWNQGVDGEEINRTKFSYLLGVFAALGLNIIAVAATIAFDVEIFGGVGPLDAMSMIHESYKLITKEFFGFLASAILQIIFPFPYDEYIGWLDLFITGYVWYRSIQLIGVTHYNYGKKWHDVYPRYMFISGMFLAVIFVVGLCGFGLPKSEEE